MGHAASPTLFTFPTTEDIAMAYGRKGAGRGAHAKITGYKIGNHKRGPGLKLHSDMSMGAAKGHKGAPKQARKAV